MAVLFSAQAIYKATHYVFDGPNNVITFDADEIGAFTPRNVWLLRQLVPAQNQIQYLLTFEPTSAQLADTNTLQGIYVEQNGQGVMIDCISIANFIAVAGGTGVIQGRYGSSPAFSGPTPSWWCVTRTDDGTAFNHGDVSTDYIGQYIGNVRLKTNSSGVSVYTFQAYGTVVAIGSDSVAIC